ncbi:MAG: NUDIX domain-containing protein [Bacteroidales bacterium]|jgi:ADP-ribose pyrophosphatase YjhB (NUDIX family)|nr:NUDIX domain-containing protein [Bacteroidales bacterium]MCI1734043.1 NUDIX domain-containing protein [Bacteroidales bacterium]
MYNIFFNNRILTICTPKEEAANDINAILFHPSENFDFSTIPDIMEKNEKFNHFIIPTDKANQEATFNKIFSKMTHVNAAGGLVTNKKGECLMIFRRGVWDLPKGWQEKGEDIKKTATREVEEETGIKAKRGNLLCITHHTYHMGKKFIIKHTSWYAMSYDGKSTPAPQTEEEITECSWIKRSKIKECLKNSYLSIAEVFKSAGKI